MTLQSLKNIAVIIILSAMLMACQKQLMNIRPTIDLSGQWQFALDTGNVGIKQKWYERDFHDSIYLPGTTDSNQKGFLNTDTTTTHLNRLYKYEGLAWYRKKITISRAFNGKNIKLILERTKQTKVWIDDNYIGESYLLQSPQQYDISNYLTPGEHTITIRVNNDLKLTPYGNVHIYTDDTQTNWNGILGQILLEASSKTYISNLQIYPDIENKKIQVNLSINNGLNISNIDVNLEVIRNWNETKKQLKSFRKSMQCDSILQLEYTLDDDAQLWDDYQQPLYELTAVISNDLFIDIKSVNFGMKKFTAAGKQFSINGRTTFLRGKHDACVFPLTGHPPMNIDGWRHYYKTAKLYGINHIRFHSYCPPSAAFEAADQLGIFLQPELPFWSSLDSDTIAARLKDEGLAMLKNYGNHPSFVMFGAGNEIWGGHDRVEKIINDLKEKDNRPLYTMGANNNIGYVQPGACSDFHIAARTPFAHDTILTHLRLSHGFVDSKDGGIINTQTPSTNVNFDYSVGQIKIPLIGHEIGQYQIYPDYKEIEKYTGVLRAWNMEVFRNRLRQAGMLDQNKDFQKASGAWSAICYKAEIEAALRTKNFAGFQLLDLQDFPGQGTALVGILDAFMESKNIVSSDEWLQSCNDVVLLLEFPKYCWQTNENFEAKLEVANYSNKTIIDDIDWEIVNQFGKVLKSGIFSNVEITNGGLISVGVIEMILSFVNHAEKLLINVKLKNSGINNSYPLWVYPKSKTHVERDGIIIANKLDERLISELHSGKKILLFPEHEFLKEKSVGGLFSPDFWNYGMFKGISEWAKKPVSPGTLGILTNPEHSIFKNFPTEFHTNWQWFSIIKSSRPLILDKTFHNYRPIVQVIDNLERNYKLGLIFEFTVGKGKLLICMARLTEILDKPEAYQLYESIIQYMKSENFAPAFSADNKLLSDLL